MTLRYSNCIFVDSGLSTLHVLRLLCRHAKKIHTRVRVARPLAFAVALYHVALLDLLVFLMRTLGFNRFFAEHVNNLVCSDHSLEQHIRLNENAIGVSSIGVGVCPLEVLDLGCKLVG